MDTTNRQQNKMLDAFWQFLPFLKEYVELLKASDPMDINTSRTWLLSTLIKGMRPVLQADLAFVGCYDLIKDSSNRLHVAKETIKLEQITHLQSSLIKRMEDLDWRLLRGKWENGKWPIILFDRGLQNLPSDLQGTVTALAVSRVALAGHDYFLFFCDVEKKEMDTPRYTDFDKRMLAVATGILEVGFQSGVPRDRTVEKTLTGFDIEKAIILNLHSPHSAEKKVGLNHAAQMKPLPKLREELENIASTDSDPDLRELATSILRNYSTNWDSLNGKVTSPQGQPATSDIQPSGKRQVIQVILLVIGIVAIAGTVIWLRQPLAEWTLVVVLIVAAIVILTAMGILSSAQLTKLLTTILNWPSRLWKEIVSSMQ